MAGSIDAPQGDGTTKAQSPRVVTFAENSTHIYASNRLSSSDTSVAPAPDVFAEEEERHQKQESKPFNRLKTSIPQTQFKIQVEYERSRRWAADLEADPDMFYKTLDTFKYRAEAEDIVTNRWVEQGIWNENWNHLACGPWKHELPLESATQWKTNSETKDISLSSTLPEQERQQKLAEAKRDDEESQIVVQQLVLELEREASRPYHQFIYQLSKERETIQGEFPVWTSPNVADINTEAYERVRDTWTRRGIWNKRWGVLPGMAWEHDKPLDEKSVDKSAADEASPPADSSHGVVKKPMKSLFEVASLIGRNPHWPFSSPVRGSPQESSRYHNIFFKPTNVDPEPSKYDNLGLKPTNAAIELVGGESEVQLVVDEKISKASGKKKVETPSERTKRLMQSMRDPISYPYPVGSTSSVRPKRKVASNSNSVSSAKPQGVSRKLRSSTRQLKGEKGASI